MGAGIDVSWPSATCIFVLGDVGVTEAPDVKRSVLRSSGDGHVLRGSCRRCSATMTLKHSSKERNYISHPC